MKLSDFQNEYHWMNGLSEYFKFNGQEERWEHIHKALYHDNWYRKRDVMIDLCSMPNSNPVHVKAWMNVLLHDHLDGVELKPQLIATLFRKYMLEEPFLVNICKFVQHFSSDGEKAEMPDMNDFLSRGQVKSKLWLVSELAKCVEGSLGNIVFYGGWYNFIAHMLYDQFDIKKIYSMDLDRNVVLPSEALYQKECQEGRFIPITYDVNKIKWNGNSMVYKHRNVETEEKVNMVVNTSCEHMDNTWFENLPIGTFVVLQTNDYFENVQHSNCCKDLNDAMTKYPMQSVMYQGELDTQLYNRFMLIGVK